jgi:hypothetical protein
MCFLSISYSWSTVIKNQDEFLPLYIRCFNAQGLVNKFLQLHDFLSSVHVDIVSISETWLDSSVKYSEFVPNGYKIFRQDRDLVSTLLIEVQIRSTIMFSLTSGL